MSTLPPDVHLERLANAYQLSRAVQVAARLELGRLLAEGPRSLRDLAETTSSDENVLGRLLRFLAQLQVVQALGENHFGPTALSDRLHTVDNIAQGEEAWQAWGALPRALRTGEPSFPEVHGESFYAYAAHHPDQEANWRATNASKAADFAPSIIAALGLDGGETIVDVGGGQGVLLAALLARHPDCRGALFDLPGPVSGAAEVFAAAEVSERCAVVAGDALTGVPPGADVYLLCRVLSNWQDREAITALSACRRAMGAQARLLVVDALMPEPGPPGPPGPTALAGPDLHHFLLWGGGFRTLQHLGSLLERAGLALLETRTTQDGAWTILECRLDASPLP